MIIINVLLYLVLPLVAAVYFYFNKKFSYFKDRGIPYLTPKFPLGNLQGMGSSRHVYDIVINLYNELHDKGAVVGMYNLIQPFYFVTDLELVKNITIRDFNNFINRGTYANEEDEPLTAHLFSLEDEKWRFVRNKLSPAFTSGKMKAMYHTIGNKGHDLIRIIEKASANGKSINVKDITNPFFNRCGQFSCFWHGIEHDEWRAPRAESFLQGNIRS
jgi:cytochrome P450 family 6